MDLSVLDALPPVPDVLSVVLTFTGAFEVPILLAILVYQINNWRLLIRTAAKELFPDIYSSQVYLSSKHNILSLDACRSSGRVKSGKRSHRNYTSYAKYAFNVSYLGQSEHSIPRQTGILCI